MSDTPRISIRIRDHGPLVVEGNVSIVDAEGRPFVPNSEKPVIALCRCGASQNKPFCDGAHRQLPFQSAPRATP